MLTPILQQLWKTHVTRFKPTDDDLDLEPPRAKSRRKVSVGEELYAVHLARQREGGKDKEEKDKKEEDIDDEQSTPPPSDILTASLEELCPATPGVLSKKRTKSQEEKEVRDWYVVKWQKRGLTNPITRHSV